MGLDTCSYDERSRHFGRLEACDRRARLPARPRWSRDACSTPWAPRAEDPPLSTSVRQSSAHDEVDDRGHALARLLDLGDPRPGAIIRRCERRRCQALSTCSSPWQRLVYETVEVASLGIPVPAAWAHRETCRATCASGSPPSTNAPPASRPDIGAQVDREQANRLSLIAHMKS